MNQKCIILPLPCLVMNLTSCNFFNSNPFFNQLIALFVSCKSLNILFVCPALVLFGRLICINCLNCCYVVTKQDMSFMLPQGR